MCCSNENQAFKKYIHSQISYTILTLIDVIVKESIISITNII